MTFNQKKTEELNGYQLNQLDHHRLTDWHPDFTKHLTNLTPTGPWCHVISMVDDHRYLDNHNFITMRVLGEWQEWVPIYAI